MTSPLVLSCMVVSLGSIRGVLNASVGGSGGRVNNAGEGTRYVI